MCKHKHQTLCQCLGDDGWFVAYQCDMCGMLCAAATLSVITEPNRLPHLDLVAYQTEMKRRAELVVKSMFEAKAKA